MIYQITDVHRQLSCCRKAGGFPWCPAYSQIALVQNIDCLVLTNNEDLLLEGKYMAIVFATEGNCNHLSVMLYKAVESTRETEIWAKALTWFVYFRLQYGA